MEPDHQQDPQLQQQQPQLIHIIEDSSSGSTTTSSSSSSRSSSFLCRQSSTRWTPTTDQIRILKDLYYNNGVRSPSAEQIQRISARLRQYGKIEGKNVFYWFQNHKARERQKKRFTVDMASAATFQHQQHHQIIRSSPSSGGAHVVNVVGPGTGGWINNKQQQSDHHHHHHQDYSFNINQPKYTNISPGISCPSSPTAHGDLLNNVGHQIGGSSTSYGSMLMEKSFRDCSISAGGAGGSNTTVGVPITSNNLGWVGIHPYSSSSSSSSSYPSFFDPNIKPAIHQIFKEAADEAHPQIETLPLFPMHASASQDIPGFCTGSNPNPSSVYNQYHTTTGVYNCYRSPQQQEDKNGSRTSLELTLNSYTAIPPNTD